MRYLALAFAIIVLGCSKGPGSGRSIVVAPSTRPAFTLDASKPFVIELGRGSGLYGLDTVKLTEDGTVELHRIKSFRPNLETTSLKLLPGQLKELIDLVNSNHITGMGASYSDPGIMDGTQWVLWIKQTPFEKAIYFNNAFPGEITDFASRLDAVLAAAGLSGASWTAVPEKEGTAQQMAIWDKIKSGK